MKKVTLLFFAIMMAVVSCGDKKNDPDPDVEDPDIEDPNNEELPAEEANALPEKIVMTSGGETRTYTITYQEGTAKINNIAESGMYGRLETYIYEGDLIIKE